MLSSPELKKKSEASAMKAGGHMIKSLNKIVGYPLKWLGLFSNILSNISNSNFYFLFKSKLI